MENIKKKKLYILNDENKKVLKWWNKNWFFVGTILVALINILVFAFAKKYPDQFIDCETNWNHWRDPLFFNPILSGFLSCYYHISWEHVLLNMLCFIVVGIYLERKKGTLGFLLYIIFATYIATLAVQSNNEGFSGYGFSGVNFFLYATIIVEYCFSFQKHNKNKTNTIFGGIMVGLIFFAMCYNEDGSFPFTFYPHD